MIEHERIIERLLSNPSELKRKKPFTRGMVFNGVESQRSVDVSESLEMPLPKFRCKEVTQEQFMRELDPNCHDVLFDENIPSICIKRKDGSYTDVKFERTALGFQKIIKNKQVQHLSGNPMQFTLIDTKPTEQQRLDFITYKQYWDERNQDGMKTKMVDAQLSYGDAGLLYYFDYKGRVKSRLLCYADGYVLYPHNDQNGDRILECVNYAADDTEYLDCYDDVYMTRFVRSYNLAEGGWIQEFHEPHGFNEIPLITKRGEVAWEKAQSSILSYEILYNIFNAVQRRFGWGLLYIKGKFNEKAQKIAGSVVLNDTNLDGNGDAKFLTPPSPENIIATLQNIEENIQKASETTFILPKDIKTGGDISGIAIQLTQSLDIEKALRGVIDWQNVADKMARLFKFGLAKELVNTGENPTAITDFENLHINAKFKIWKPFSEYEYNSMLISLANSGLISKQTGIVKNTESTPDEEMRVSIERKALADADNPQNVRQIGSDISNENNA